MDSHSAAPASSALPSARFCEHGFIVRLDVIKRAMGKSWPAFLNKLTITTPQVVGPPKIAKCYDFLTVDGVRWIRLPRGKIPVIQKIIPVQCEITAANRQFPARATLAVDMFENQRTVVDYIYERVRPKIGHACELLEMQAGLGKTFVAADLIVRCQMRTLFITPSDFLASQAVTDLKMSLEGVTVARWKNRKNNPGETADVIVMVINTALKQPPAFFARIGLTIIDEVHTACSEARRKIFPLASTPIIIGMSATTSQRLDKFDAIAHRELAGAPTTATAHSSGMAPQTKNAQVAGVIYADQVPGWIHDDVKFTGKVIKINYKGKPENTQVLTHEATGKMFIPRMNAQFFNDTDRQQVAVAAILELAADPIRNIFVFAEECGALRVLRDLVIAAGIDKSDISMPESDDPLGDNRTDNDITTNTPSSGSSLLMGGAKAADIAFARDSRIIFTTYGYSLTGVSIPKMNSIVFYSSRKSGMLQALPRVMRRSGDTTIPRIIVDIVDAATPVKKQWYARKVAYDYFGFTVESR